MRAHSIGRRMAAAILLSAASAPDRLPAQKPLFVGWPEQLASHGPALADSIARDFGARPDTIAFGGRDTIRVFFWNPTFWHGDMTSRMLPMQTLPGVRNAALRVAEDVWTMVGREAKVSYVRVAFLRVVREPNAADPTKPREIAAQEVSGAFTPEMLQSHREPMLAIVLREGGRWGETATVISRRPVITQAGAVPDPDKFTVARAALVDSIDRDIGRHMSEVSMRGRDTVGVIMGNPPFLSKGATSEDLPDASLPQVREEAKRLAQFIWDRHGQNPNINVIRVTFRRDWRELVQGKMWVQHPGQDVIADFTRQQMQTGKPDTVHLTIVDRSNGSHRPPAAPR